MENTYMHTYLPTDQPTYLLTHLHTHTHLHSKFVESITLPKRILLYINIKKSFFFLAKIA